MTKTLICRDSEIKTHKEDKSSLLNDVIELKIKVKQATSAISHMETEMKEINTFSDKENGKKERANGEVKRYAKVQKKLVSDMI